MNIPRHTRRPFTMIGYLSDQKMTSFIIVILLILTEVCSISYVVLHLKTGSFTNCLQAGLQFVAVMPATATLFTMLYQKDEIHGVIDGFQKIFDACTSNDLT